MLNAADLPDDIDTLKAMILAAEGREERHVERIAQLEKAAGRRQTRAVRAQIREG
ncbi:hypothetical protein ACFOHS_23155 [Jhaorihella thermophila]